MLDFWKDTRDAMQELTFFALWGNPFIASLAGPQQQTAPAEGLDESLRELPQVQAALMNTAREGYAEAVIRMLILMAKSRGAVGQSPLERSNEILTSREPFKSMGVARRADYNETAAVTTLPTLIANHTDREKGIALVEEIAGDKAEMAEATLRMLVELRDILGLPPL